MPKINAAITQCYYAFDTGNSVAKTGDVANHTLRVVKDGTIGTIAATPAEVSNTLAKGLYKVVIAANENTGASMILAGESVTADIIIMPVHWTNESNMAQIAGDEQSVTDLKDFADTGYNPTTHKVAGVVLADTTTANTDMRGTDSAALATNLNDGTITLHSDYDPAKTAAQAGDAMILSSAYDRAKTAAQSGDAMDLLAATIVDIQDGLGTEAKQNAIGIQNVAILDDTGTTIPALIAALNDITVADILAGKIDTSTTLGDAMRTMRAKLAGVSVTAGANALTYRRDNGATKDFTETVNSNTGARAIS